MNTRSFTHIACSVVLGLGLTLVVLGLTANQLPIAGAAGPLYVATTGNDGNDCLSAGTACLTIGGAVGKAASGDTINIAAGIYAENVSISGKVLAFSGAGAASTIVDGGAAGQVFATDQDVTLADLTLRNGNSAGSDGGGLYATGAVTLTNVNIFSSTAFFNGGGVYATGPATISGGVFQGNAGLNGGGAYISNTLALTDTQFLSNTTTGWGGGARALLAADVSGGVFQNNSAASGGGLFADAALTLTGTQFLSNTASTFGGGAYFGQATALASATFMSNTANSGGGAQFDGLASVTDSNFLTNTANNTGGGAYFNAVAALTNTVFSGNLGNSSVAGGGGATFAYTATLSGGRFVSNTTNFAGGGAYFGQPATIAGTQFTGNIAATNRGGGAYFNASANLASVLFFANQTPSDRGAGAYFRGPAALNSTVFFSNAAASRGGGAYFFASAALTFTAFLANAAGVHGGGGYFNDAFQMFDVAFVSNTAQTGNGGGLYQNLTGNGRIANALFGRNLAGVAGADLYLGTPGTNVILNSTLANANGSANPGAAIYVNAGSLGLTNTLFANYAAGLVVTSGVTLSADYNLFFNAPTNAITGSHSLTGVDPLLVNPANFDFRLGPGSPAAGAGVDAGVTTDLDGTPRANPPSIGAYELPTFSLTVTTTGTGSGTVTRAPSATVYAQGSVVTLTAAANAGSNFAGWSGDVSGLTNPITVTLDSNKSVTATFALIPPPPAADLKISLRGAPSQAAPGALLTYTLVVTNTGPDLATVVRLTDTLSVSSTFQSLASPAGWICATPSVGGGGQIVCTTGSLAVGAPATFTISAQLAGQGVLPPAALVSNTAIVTSATHDPTVPNSATATIAIFAYRYLFPFIRR